MASEKHLKESQDRFVAFAFSASDFLLEIDKQGKIVFCTGKARSLTGREPFQLEGLNWIDLFSAANHSNLTALVKGVQKAGRIGPLMVELVNIQTGEKHRSLIMGIVIPESKNIFLTLNATQSFFDFLAVGDYQDARLQDEKEFEISAIRAFETAKRKGQKLDVTFLEIEKIEEYKKSLPFAEANNFTDNFQTLLKEQSFQGETVSQVDDDKYALIHDAKITPQFIEDKIQQLIKRTTPDTQEIGLKSKTIEADMDTLTEREARRALIYTIKQVEEKGLDDVDGNLSQSFDHYLQENAIRITNLKNLVGKQAFKLHYQPIVYIPSEDICHYEALVRFKTNESPYELIVFGEDIGIAPDVDMAVLKQAIGFIKTQIEKTPSIRVAVNISGQSIQSEEFCDKMLEVIEETKVGATSLLFEVTESTAISDLERVNFYIQRLRKRDFEVCLDDFGAGAASFQYLNGLDIDCVKIDGKYIRDALKSSRDEAMVRNLARMCQDLKVTAVAEMVETQEQLDYLVKIGVDKAQGWLFGKPMPRTEYKKRQK